MTKKKDSTPTPASMLADLEKLVCHPSADAADKRKAIEIAYEVGMSEGRLAGATHMGEQLVAAARARNP
jgi:hypothetical protein